MDEYRSPCRVGTRERTSLELSCSTGCRSYFGFSRTTPPLIAAQKYDSVGLSCAEPVRECLWDLCEGTGRLIVVFSGVTGMSGKAVGCAPWSPIREKLMAGEGQEARIFRCKCESGQNHPQLDRWVPD